MKKQSGILEKINILNETILRSIPEDNNLKLIQNFTDTSKILLDADFAFAWWKFESKYKLAYKSIDTPYKPTIPQAKNNHKIKRSGNVFIDSNVEEKNYKLDTSMYMKSYIVISIHYGEHVYGNIVLCYKKPRIFTKEELILANLIGNSAAHGVTIHWLIENEKAIAVIAEKQKKTETLLAQEKLKTEFIANATHELRTPLAIMKGNADLALMGKGDLKSSREALQEVNSEIKSLSSLLEDLELVTSSNKNFNPMKNFNSVEVNALLNTIVQRLKAIAREKNINLKINSGKTLHLPVLGEEKYLEKLFLNLIKNAVAYGKENGSIIVNASKNKSSIKIQISDDGMGISKEDLPRIFERFYRADKSHTGKNSGLGLAIAKWVTDKHNGKIEVKSVPQKGTTFTVTLPLLKND